ncbi:MAG: competence/damage-inducible protein A [Synechococcaceae cyanobacterium SM2_3_2]|nr:competence/damage-inducible protein A [Synechococcaceae cyanobacterium SM2_3_2]
MTASLNPSAEILCIGTELLLGEILNSNAQYLAIELAKLGIPHHYQTVVGDNIPRIHAALEVAIRRSTLLLLTGGLGPTPDDLTHAALASYFGVQMVEHSQVWEEIVRRFAERGIDPSPSNRKQALLPEGAMVLPNPSGSACGIIWKPIPSLTLMTFPGVPSEMHGMWEQTSIPYLQQQGWGQEVFFSQVLRHWGVAESTLAEKAGSLLNQPNPTVAPYAGKGEVRLRVTARAHDPVEAQAILYPVVKQLQAIAGDDYYGSDDDTLASVVGQLLTEKGQTVSVAESCTGGLLGQLITGIPGSSSYFVGGILSYGNPVKQQMLGVTAADLMEHGAVSETVAAQMAIGVQSLLKTDWSLSITGIAGPDGGTETKPVGLVYIGLRDPWGQVEVSRHTFGSRRGREGIRWSSAQTALDRLRRRLLNLAQS